MPNQYLNTPEVEEEENFIDSGATKAEYIKKYDLGKGKWASEDVSLVMTQQVTNWVNKKLVPAMAAMGLWTKADGHQFDMYAKEIYLDLDSTDLKGWLFAPTGGAGDLLIQINAPVASADAVLVKDAPIETDRVTEAALDLIVDNRGAMAITKSISRAVEVATEENHQVTKDIHFDVNTSLQAGVSGTDANFGATALASISANIGGSRQKTVGDSKANTTTKYISDTVVVPGYSKYRIIGEYDKVTLNIPYTLTMPFDFGIEIYEAARSTSGKKTFAWINDKGFHHESFNNTNNNTTFKRRFAFENIKELYDYMRKTLYKYPAAVRKEFPSENNLTSLETTDITEILGRNVDLSDADDRFFSDSYTKDRFAAAWAYASGISEDHITSIMKASEDLLHPSNETDLHLTKTGVFEFKGATDVALTVTEEGTYSSASSGSEYNSHDTATASQLPSWSGAPIAQ